MNMLLTVAQWLADNLFGQPAILLGLVALVGLIAQGKSFNDIVLGTVKTIAGFLILVTGSNVLVAALNNFQPIIQQAFGITTPTTAGGAMGLDQFMATYSGQAALVMTVGFLINVILARVTRAKYIYLTGHLMFWVALTMIAVVKEVFPNASMALTVLFPAVVCGVYWTLQPALMQPYMRRIMGNDNVAYGHTSAFGSWVGAVVGGRIGNPEHSTEKVTIPNTISFMKDVTVSTSLTIGLVAVIAALFAGREFVSEMAGGMNYIIYALLEGLKFGAGTAVLLQGVRMILAEIVPAFRGIATKIVPNAKPALDCPIIFPYAPMAVIIGFLSAFVTFIVLMLIFGATGWAVIIPPMIALFFPGGAAGVFGNSTGGVRGAIFGGAFMGFLLAVGQAICAKMLGTTAPELAIMADPDWYILVLIFKPLLKLFA